MSKSILLVGTYTGVGLTSAVLGLYHALDRKGVKTGFFKPVMQYAAGQKQDLSYDLMAKYCRGDAKPLTPETVQDALDDHSLDELMEELLRRYEHARGDADVVILEGLLESAEVPYAAQVNQAVARALNAEVIIVGSAKADSAARLDNQIAFVVDQFGGFAGRQVLGAIINHVDGEGLSTAEVRDLACFKQPNFLLLGAIPVRPELSAPRVSDLQRHLKAEVLFAGDMEKRRVHEFVIFARTVPNARQFLIPNNCIFCPGDRDDALMAVTISASAGTQLACLVLTGPTEPSKTVLDLCRPLIEKSGLPLLHVDSSTWGLTSLMEDFNRDLPIDDEARLQKTQEFFADHIGYDWVQGYLQDVRENILSPASFRYQLVKDAIAANKIIVLPEGDEPRTVVAASQVAARGMARCVLLANPASVAQVAAQQGVTLGEGVSVIDPEAVREHYIARLVELRANKGMNETLAREQLQDNVMLGTMMLEAGEVDGLVSGAVHTTANTMRPPLQIIKTAPNASMVSSVFFMCLPDKVMVYGDCAIVPKPNADELAQIAIQSNDTAKAFGITPRVAMISYSTGASGSGEDVEKVKAATEKVRELRPDIIVDGPLQYDAAAVASVAASKAPNSPVAGQATVFIFPDLNTGNTTYKAVQRSANAISMGPVLQGMRKPVNDLSRGALIDDIVYTIAITAIQAAQNG